PVIYTLSLHDALPISLERVFFVAGVDALGRVTKKIIDAVLEPALFVEHWTAYVLGDAGIDGRLEHDDIALPEVRADGARRTDHRDRKSTRLNSSHRTI